MASFNGEWEVHRVPAIRKEKFLVREWRGQMQRNNYDCGVYAVKFNQIVLETLKVLPTNWYGQDGLERLDVALTPTPEDVTACRAAIKDTLDR